MARPLLSSTNDRIPMMTTNVPLSRIPARQMFLLCKSRLIYIVTSYMFNRCNSLINWVVGLNYLHTSNFSETPSLERLPTRAKKCPLTNKITLSLIQHQPSISYYYHYCYYYYHYYHFLIIITIAISIIIIVIIILFLSLLLLLVRWIKLEIL